MIVYFFREFFVRNIVRLGRWLESKGLSSLTEDEKYIIKCQAENDYLRKKKAQGYELSLDAEDNIKISYLLPSDKKEIGFQFGDCKVFPNSTLNNKNKFLMKEAQEKKENKKGKTKK